MTQAKSSPKQSLEDLQKAARKVEHSQSPQEKSEALAKAFELFSQETIRLEAAYSILKEKYALVNFELEETNNTLRQKIAELDSTKGYLEKILANMSQGLLFVDYRGVIMTYNNTAETILVKSRTSILGKLYSECFSDQAFGFSLEKALKESKAPSLIRLFTGEEHEKKQLEIETAFVRKEGKETSEIEGIIILIRDVTEIKRLQLIANRNERMKVLGEMAAMVAHEIRNPLGGIKGFASLLSRDLEENPHLQNMANQIIEGTDSLNKLVTNVLNYSRPMQVELAPHNLVDTSKDAIAHIKMDSVLNSSISLETNFPETSIKAMIDPQLFKSALLNLLVNAIHAMPDGGTLTLTVKTTGKDAFVTITDTGIGISPDDLEMIFRPFFTTKPRGHGFGLAEVHRVIQEHNGVIDASSVLGKGTTFTIQLPLTNLNPHPT